MRDWIDDGAFVAAVIRDGTDIRTVTHLGRHATVLQRTALEAITATCAVEGCSAGVRLEIDHRVDWTTTRHTTLDELDRLCEHHHDLKTHHGYHLAPGTGTRQLLPPDHEPPHHDGTTPPPMEATGPRPDAGPPPHGPDPPPNGADPPPDAPAPTGYDSGTAYEQARLPDTG